MVIWALHHTSRAAWKIVFSRISNAIPCLFPPLKSNMAMENHISGFNRTYMILQIWFVFHCHSLVFQGVGINMPLRFQNFPNTLRCWTQIDSLRVLQRLFRWLLCCLFLQSLHVYQVYHSFGCNSLGTIPMLGNVFPNLVPSFSDSESIFHACYDWNNLLRIHLAKMPKNG